MALRTLNGHALSVWQCLIPLVVLATIFTVEGSFLAAHGLGAPRAAELLWTFEFRIVLAWWVSVDRRIRGFSEIALQTGMRCKEQFTRIDWSCVDLARKNLRVPQSKNGLGRHIPLNAEARAAFQGLLERQIGDGPIPISPKGPIFVGKGGKRLKGVRHWFLRATRKAGLADFTWHDLRHTFASRLVMADVDIRTVAELLGHKNIQMTMRYAHLAPEPPIRR